MSDPDDRDPGAPADRRAFFRIGLERLRSRTLDSLRAFERGAGDVARQASVPSSPAPGSTETARRRASRAAPPRAFVRPPGAIPEARFVDTCERCRACLDACPVDAIRPADDYMGPALRGTPILRPELEACVLCLDVPCASACPTGALRPVAVADIHIGTAVTFRNLCLNAHETPCRDCVEECPIPGALTAGEGGFPAVDPDLCTGCGICVMRCPASPKALHIRPA